MTRTLPNLPASVAGLVEMTPVEDLIHRILTDAFPDMADDIVTLVEQDAFSQHDLIVLARRSDPHGPWDGDDRFIDNAGLTVHVYAGGIDADERAALVSEAVRVALRDAWMNPVYYPGLGQLKKVHQYQAPLRKTDWMPSQGPVQYADLPHGWVRYESKSDIYIRRARVAETVPHTTGVI